MGELNEQIHIEDHTMGIQEGEEGPPAVGVLILFTS